MEFVLLGFCCDGISFFLVLIMHFACASFPLYRKRLSCNFSTHFMDVLVQNITAQAVTGVISAQICVFAYSSYMNRDYSMIV